MHSYAAVTHRFWTLEDTLVGYMFNDLVWCGQQEKDRGRRGHHHHHPQPDMEGGAGGGGRGEEEEREREGKRRVKD